MIVIRPLSRFKFSIVISIFLFVTIQNISSQNFINLGTGLSNYPRTLYADTSSGILYAGGDFLDAGGISVQHIAKWNGITWDSIAGSIFWQVKDIAKFNDTIYAVASYPEGVVKWDGITWKDIGTTTSSFANGLYATDSILYISGFFETIGGINSRCLALYNGNSIQGVPHVADSGSHAYNSIVYNDDVYLAGNYNNSLNPAIADIAYLHNSTWLPVVNGIQGGFSTVNCFTIFQNMLVIGGTFQSSWGDPGNSILLWDGNSLSQLGNGIDGDVLDMVVYNNELYIGGSISSWSGQYGHCLQKWDGSQWSNLGLIFNNAVSSLAIMNNELYVGGAFTQVNGIPMSRIMKLTLPVSDQIYDNSRKFTIYPNPNQGEFYVNGESQFDEIELFDVSGKLIETLVIDAKSNPKKVKLQNIAPGMYIVKLKYNSEVSYRKIIVN